MFVSLYYKVNFSVQFTGQGHNITKGCMSTASSKGMPRQQPLAVKDAKYRSLRFQLTDYSQPSK